MKPIFRTDLALVVLGFASLATGILIHHAGHFESHDVWHNWSVAHFFINIALVIAVIVHVKQHWGWFKGLLRKSSLKKKISVFVTIAFLAVALSGIYLLIFAEGQGSHAGLAHYKIGIVFGVVGILHLLRRWNIFSKGVFSRKK